jgi:hypothetical protein
MNLFKLYGEFGWGGTTVIKKHSCPKIQLIRIET